jgi:hypothetical protein
MPNVTSTGTTFEGRSIMSTTLHPAVWIVEDDLDDRVLLNEAFLDTKMPCSLTLYPDAITALQNLVSVYCLNCPILLYLITICLI